MSAYAIYDLWVKDPVEGLWSLVKSSAKKTGLTKILKATRSSMRITGRRLVTDARDPGKYILAKKNPLNPRLGSGARFKKCVKSVKGADDPRAVCASAGFKKYGKKKMLKMAQRGKRRKNPVLRVPASEIINNEARKLSNIYNVPIGFAEKVLREVGRDYQQAVEKILRNAKKAV